MTITEVITNRLKPALVIDTDLEADLQTEIDAQLALQGWVEAEITDKERVYVACLVLQALIPRLLLVYAEEVEKLGAAESSAEFSRKVDYLKELKKSVDDQVRRAAREAAPEDVAEDLTTPPPLQGIRAI